MHREEIFMKAMTQLLGVVAALSLGACAPGAADTSVPTQTEPSEGATTEQSITFVDCQAQVTTCVRAAKSFAELGACTTKFQACTTQAATDLASEATQLRDCTTKSNQCLAAALVLADVTVCRTAYDTCTKDAQTTGTSGLLDAIAATRAAIDKATQVAAGA